MYSLLCKCIFYCVNLYFIVQIYILLCKFIFYCVNLYFIVQIYILLCKFIFYCVNLIIFQITIPQIGYKTLGDLERQVLLNFQLTVITLLFYLCCPTPTNNFFSHGCTLEYSCGKRNLLYPYPIRAASIVSTVLYLMLIVKCYL